MSTFDHEKLDVYHTAIEFVAMADDIVENLRRRSNDKLESVSIEHP